MKWHRVHVKLLCAIAAALLVLIDRLTKFWATTSLSPEGYIRGIDGLFRFRLAQNSGAAFSMLAASPAVVSVLSTVLLTVLGVVVFKARMLSYGGRLCLCAVWAGGVGNLIDRLLHGAVTDFIEVTFISFPIFNFADICVTLGAIGFALYMFASEKKEKGANVQ